MKLSTIGLVKPKLVYLVVSLLALFFALQMPSIEIDTDPENMLPADNAQRVFHNLSKTTFAMHDAIVLGAVAEKSIYTSQNLAAIKQITDHALSLDGVVAIDLMSLSTVDNIDQMEGGGIRFEWMMKSAPQNNEQAKQVQANIERLPLLFNTLVSEDAKAAAVYIPIKDKNQSFALAKQLDAYATQLDSKLTWHITGLPVAEDRFGTEMFIQMAISAPLAGAMIFLLLWVFFRNLTLIIAPMIVAMATVIITMGLLIGLGFTVHIMSSMIAIFLMPIAVVDSVHILSEFSDRYKPGESVNKTLKTVLSHLFKPMLLTSVTSAVGFFSLLLTPIPPVQIFGAHIGFGILLAFILTIAFVPAYISRMKPEALAKLQAAQHKAQQAQATGKLAIVLANLRGMALNRSGLWLIAFSALFAFAIIGVRQIEINDNPVRWFKADHQLRIADKVLNEHFAGTYDAYLVFQSTPDDQAIAKVVAQHQHDWLQQTFQNVQASQNAMDDLISAIDDRLFEQDDAQLDAILLELEAIQQQQKVFLQPAILDYLQQLQRHLQASGLVGKSNSLADVVKVVNRELHTGEDKDYQLPNSANAVAQTLLQYQSSHRPQDLWHFVTTDYQQSLLWLQLTSGDNQDMQAVVDLVDAYVAANPLPEGITVNWAGKAYLNLVWQGEMVSGMLSSLVSAFVVVFAMMVLLFRSVIYGVLAMLPLTFTITLIYGLIGWIGKDYDMPIAVLSALTLGLSVDFAIHFLQRSRELIKQTGNFEQSMQLMFAEPGRAIMRNAIVVAVGFTPLLFAPLMPYVTVGFFLASIMAISALVTLIMLPAVMKQIQHWL